MKLPNWPSLQPLVRITPSLYNAALICPGRAFWMEFGDRNALPSGPQGILGTAFHAVVEDAARGLLPAEAEQRRQAAENRFDVAARHAWNCAHPLLWWRYNDVLNVPFYYTRRAEAVEAIASFYATAGVLSRRTSRIEWSASSRDGVIQGRIDYVDETGHLVADYKSGSEPPEGQADPPSVLCTVG